MRRGRISAHAPTTYGHPDHQHLYKLSAVLLSQHSSPHHETGNVFWVKVSLHMSLKKTQTKTNQPTKQTKPQSNCKFPLSASFFLPSFLQMMQLQRRPGELQLIIMAESTLSSASSGHPALQSRHLAGLIRKWLMCLATRTTPMLLPFP